MEKRRRNSTSKEAKQQKNRATAGRQKNGQIDRRTFLASEVFNEKKEENCISIPIDSSSSSAAAFLKAETKEKKLKKKNSQ